MLTTVKKKKKWPLTVPKPTSKVNSNKKKFATKKRKKLQVKKKEDICHSKKKKFAKKDRVIALFTMTKNATNLTVIKLGMYDVREDIIIP